MGPAPPSLYSHLALDIIVKRLYTLVGSVRNKGGCNAPLTGGLSCCLLVTPPALPTKEKMATKDKDTENILPSSFLPVPEHLPRRYPTRVTPKEAMERAELFIRRNLPLNLNKLHELAMGAVVMETDGRSGKVKVYKTTPDKDALKYLIDRGMGKVPERFEVTGEDGGPVTIQAWAEPIIEGEVVKRDKGGEEAST